MRWWLALPLITLPFTALGQDSPDSTSQEREDRGRIVAFIEDNLSGAGREVILRGFDGALSSRATATQLTIADEQGIWLTLNDVVLDWNRAALLSGQVSVSDLTAAEIIIERAPVADTSVPTPEASGFSLPDLPVSVEVERIAADRVVLGEALLGQPVEGTIEAALSLSGGEGSASLKVARTDDGPTGNIDLAASYSNESQTLTIDLTATEGEDGIAARLLSLPGWPSVDLRINGAGPLTDFAATVGLRTDGSDRLSGDITLTGIQEGTGETGTRFAADFSGDLAPLFLPQYSDFFGPEVRLSVNGARRATGRLDLSDLSVAARSIRLQGSAQIAPDGLPEAFALVGSLADPEGRPVLLPGANGTVSVDSVDLDVGYDNRTDETWRAKLSGRGLDSVQATLERFDLNGSGRINRNAKGSLIGGTLNIIAAGLVIEDPALAAAVGREVTAKTRFWWQEGDGALQIASLDVDAGGVLAEARGSIASLEQALRLVGSARVTAPDLGRFTQLAGRPLSGRAVIDLSGQGSPLGGDFDVEAKVTGTDLTIDQPEADNILRGDASVFARVVRDATGTEIRRFDVASNALSATGKGTIATDMADLDLSFRVPDLTRLGPAYGGTATGTMQVSGALTRGQARVEADFDGADLQVGIPEVDRLLQGASAVRLRADVTDSAAQIETLTVTAPTLIANAQGKVAQAGSDVTARVELADLSVLRPGYGGRIAADLAATGTMDDARLTVTADANGLRVGQAQTDRLLAGDTALSATLRLLDGAVGLEALQLDNPQLSASATGRSTGGRSDLDLRARLANLGLLLPEFPGPVTVQGTASQDGGGYTVDLSGTGPGQINARVSGRLGPNLARADLSISGTAQAGLANPFLGTRVVSGPVSVNLQLSGPLALSSLSGRVALSQGRLADPSLPFTLQGIDASADLSGGQARLDAQMQVSTGGSVAVGGGLGLAAPFNADLTARLSSVVLRDPQLFETRANGEIRVTGPLTGGALIAGRIALPETEIRIASTGLGGAGSLEELTHINEPAPVRETRRRAGLLGTGAGGASAAARAFNLDLVISAPNRVFVRGRGLDAELGGELLIRGTTQDVIPSGGFTLIRGRLDILGRRLNLTEATVQLQGSFDPTLRVVATTDADGISSSVVIGGSATDPQVSFTSQPQLPQEEVLAQLLFGRRLDQISAFQALQLANAVATLAGRGGDGIIGNLRNSFGLDDLDVQTGADGQAQLTAGKYLTEKVYSEVVIDQAGKSQITLNLDLTDTLTVKGRVGADGDTGIGLFYEKDY